MLIYALNVISYLDRGWGKAGCLWVEADCSEWTVMSLYCHDCTLWQTHTDNSLDI